MTLPSPPKSSETRKPLLLRPRSCRRAPTSTSRVADWEAENLFLGGWVCVGHAQPLAERGRFVTRQIKDESLLFVGDDEGRAPASSTSAATAAPGSSSEPEGTMRRLQCPYHAWCYRFDGSLLSAPHTEEIEDFDPAGSGSAASASRRSTACVRRHLRHGAARSPGTSGS